MGVDMTVAQLAHAEGLGEGGQFPAHPDVALTNGQGYGMAPFSALAA